MPSSNTDDFFVIDNFLDPSLFNQLSDEQRLLHDRAQSRRWTLLSQGKTTIPDPDLKSYPASKQLIREMTSTQILEAIRNRFAYPAEITPLAHCADRQGHSFFHRMVYPSFLSTHVDRSYLYSHERSLVKVANAIYMISPEWHEEYGGYTYIGAYNFKRYIEYRPNRLIVFKHTSTTFHGVQPLAINSPSRYTAYMDYYVPACCIHDLNKIRRQFWKHETVYLPEPGSIGKFFSAKHYLGDLIQYCLSFFGAYRFQS